MRRTHSYEVTVTWTGNRGTGTSGYRAYGRDHDVAAEGRRASTARSIWRRRSTAPKWPRRYSGQCGTIPSRPLTAARPEGCLGAHRTRAFPEFLAAREQSNGLTAALDRGRGRIHSARTPTPRRLGTRAATRAGSRESMMATRSAGNSDSRRDPQVRQGSWPACWAPVQDSRSGDKDC